MGALPLDNTSNISLSNLIDLTRYNVSFSLFTTALRVRDGRDRRLMLMDVAVSGAIVVIKEEEEGRAYATSGGSRTRGNKRRNKARSTVAVTAEGEGEEEAVATVDKKQGGEEDRPVTGLSSWR
jgi:hypothetical protein